MTFFFSVIDNMPVFLKNFWGIGGALCSQICMPPKKPARPFALAVAVGANVAFGGITRR